MPGRNWNDKVKECRIAIEDVVVDAIRASGETSVNGSPIGVYIYC